MERNCLAYNIMRNRRKGGGFHFKLNFAVLWNGKLARMSLHKNLQNSLLVGLILLGHGSFKNAYYQRNVYIGLSSYKTRDSHILDVELMSWIADSRRLCG